MITHSLLGATPIPDIPDTLNIPAELRRASVDPALADSGSPQFFAGALDPNRLLRGPEPKPPRNAVLKQTDVCVREFDYFVAIHANEVVVVRVLKEIGIVVFDILSQIDLRQQTRFDQQGKRSVEGRAGNRAVDLPRSFPQIICRKVLVTAERSLDDDLPLARTSQSLSLKELVNLSLDFRNNHSELSIVAKDRSRQPHDIHDLQ